MGEIRVKVKLTNAADEEFARTGRIPRDQVRSLVADGLVDTGAVRTIIPVQVQEKLGLSTRGMRVAEYADGRNDAAPVCAPVIVEIMDRDTAEDPLVLGDEVLIGQTVLEKLDLLADCTGRKLIPNPAHPDQPVTKVK